MIAAVLGVAPYVALVELGRVWLEGPAHSDPGRARTILILLVAAFCLRLTLYFAALLVAHFADLKLGYVLRTNLVHRLARAPLGWFTQTNSGRVRKGLHDDIEQIHQLVAHAPVEMTTALVSPLLTLTYAFIVDWRLGLLAIAVLPFYAITMLSQTKGMGEMTMKMDQKLAKVSETMLEFARGIVVVKAFGRVGQAHENYQNAATDFANFYRDWCAPLFKIAAIGEALIAAPPILAVNLGGGTAMVAAGWVSPAEVLATTLIALLVPKSISVMANVTWSYQNAGGAAIRVVELLETPVLPEVAAAEATPSETPASHTPRGCDIEFENVTFRYEPDAAPAVNNVSLRLAEGTVTALVGPSGGGKSTLASLLARFHDPQEGKIRIGGVDIAQMSTSTLYSTVAFVLQNPKLLGMSIHDNIALGRPTATREEVIAAAKAANIDHEIVALPHGYDTLYGAEVSLSGGQGQRIAIARALLMDAPVLILDEATSFADPENEALIQQALSRLARGRTVLVIGHRATTVRGANQIAVLDAGRVVALGTHDELADNEFYARLMATTAGEETTR